MDFFLYFFLFVFGTMFGSFASVVIYRLKSGEGGIWGGRSHCKTCERDLSALELIPIFSWLFQGGKCAGCKDKISAIYPILEVSTGILFSMVGYFLISPDLIFAGDIFEITKMLFFLFLMFLTIIYVFYDILYLEIPESVLLIANIMVFIALIAQDAGFMFLSHMGIQSLDVFSYTNIIICFAIVSALYYIMLAGLKEIYDGIIVLACMGLIGFYIYETGGFYGFRQESALLSGTLAALGIFISFFLQIVLSGGRAMGAGDLRIAILMGLLVGASLAFPAWMICYLVGSIIGIGLIIITKIRSGKKAAIKHQIPFGPFIASGYLAVLFFHPQISNFIAWYF